MEVPGYIIFGLIILIVGGIFISSNQKSFIIDYKIQSNQHQRLRDVGASPVFSANSDLGHNLKNKSLTGVIELDYKDIQMTRNMLGIQKQDALVALTLQRQVICMDWEMYGRKTDGGWPVCKAKALLPQKPCTVYSFGIQNDWSFDDAYHAAHGCTIRTFDPSMNDTKQHVHKPGVIFYPIGLSTKKRINKEGWHLESYRQLLKQFHDEDNIIPYLKFDIDEMEWDVLENMIADGVLRNVMQLSFELHFKRFYQIYRYFQMMKKLESLNFRRWFYHHRLNGFPYQCDQSYINMRFIKK